MGNSATTKSMTKSLVGLLIPLFGVVLIILAIWNWRANTWAAMVWLLCFVMQLVIRIPQARRVRDNAIVSDRKDTAEQTALLGMFVAMMFLPLLQMATGIFAFADYTLPDWAAIIGVVVQLPFLWLFWRSHADLGINWSPGLELRENHALVTSGIYAYIRHPMYAAFLLSVLAQPLLIQNWIAGVLAVPAFIVMWIVRMPREEAMMREKFGVEYGRLLPARRATVAKIGEIAVRRVQNAKSPSTGTWSDGLSQPRVSRWMVTPVRRSAAWGDKSRWSMRMPWSLRQAPSWKSQNV